MNITKEELEKMPISRLQGLDIQSPEEETMVQEVLEEKRENEIKLDINKDSLPSSATDFMTPEKEAVLQTQLDTPEENPDEGLEIEEPPQSDVEAKTAFRAFCTAKGPIKHKNNCTRSK